MSHLLTVDIRMHNTIGEVTAMLSNNVAWSTTKILVYAGPAPLVQPVRPWPYWFSAELEFFSLIIVPHFFGRNPATAKSLP